MSKFIEGMIECPFYLREGEGFIACEGIITGSSCHHRFENDFQKRNYEIELEQVRNTLKMFQEKLSTLSKKLNLRQEQNTFSRSS